MRNRTKLVLAGLAATLFMSLAVGSASAQRFEVNEQGFLVRWTQLRFAAGGGLSVSCPVTLEGSFHSRVLSKVSGQLVGYITQAFVGGCNGTNTARALTETLPWHIQYNSFEGALPNINKIFITLIGARFQINVPGTGTCLAGTTQANPAFGAVELAANHELVVGLTALPEHTIPLGGEFVCAFVSPGRFEGRGIVGTLRIPQTQINVRLVR